ncbi:hypothetical protein [Neotabrizicola sp. VNH66]|uniref:hypothetical protein n=1 Tax=Neotabrizicola sp. VNH66 TaxID=3400918 RepID=UPI003C0AFE39
MVPIAIILGSFRNISAEYKREIHRARRDSNLNKSNGSTIPYDDIKCLLILLIPLYVAAVILLFIIDYGNIWIPIATAFVLSVIIPLTIKHHLKKVRLFLVKEEESEVHQVECKLLLLNSIRPEHNAAEQDEIIRRRRADAVLHRDSDHQSKPYAYEIGRHALETLAMRYGIAHYEKTPDGKMREGEYIKIRKIRPIGGAKYEALLTEYRDRQVIAVIEKGTEYVKTFYPPTGRAWFDDNKEWEAAIKGNSGFSIKEMAKMHFEQMKRKSK